MCKTRLKILLLLLLTLKKNPSSGAASPNWSGPHIILFHIITYGGIEVTYIFKYAIAIAEKTVAANSHTTLVDCCLKEGS